MRNISLAIISFLVISASLADTPSLNVQWHNNFNNDDYSFRIIPDLTFYDDKVVVVTSDGSIALLNVINGATYWRKVYRYKFSCGVAFDQSRNQLYVCTQDGYIIALSTQGKGRILWKRNLSSESVVRPTITNYGVHVRTRDGAVTTLSHLDGKVLWAFYKPIPDLSLTGASEIVNLDTHLLYGNSNGKVIILTSEKGDQVFEHSLSTPSITSDLLSVSDIDGAVTVLPGGRVLASNHHGVITLVNIKDGEEIWKSKRDLYIHSPIVSYSDSVISVLQDNTVQALDLNTGAEIYKVKIPSKGLISTFILYKDYILVGNTKGKMYVLNQSDGTLVTEVTVNSKLFNLKKFKLFIDPNHIDQFFIYDLNGRIFAMELG